MSNRPSAITTLTRGLKRRCPRCGHGRLFRKWYTLHEHCHQCQLVFERHDGSNWVFMYMSTAFITGLIVIGMFLLRPSTLWVGQIVVCGLAVGALLLTLPCRKGVAIALDYLTDTLGHDGEVKVNLPADRPTPESPNNPPPTE